MEDPREVGLDSGLYLYCFCRELPSLSPEKGIDGVNPTFALSHRNLCALVSRVSLDEYCEEALNHRIEDLKWLTPKVKRHEEIIRSVMRSRPVIPVKFGTLYTSDERVLKVLRNGYAAFCSFLEFIRDKEEWGVKVYADEVAIQSVAAGLSDPLQELDRRLSSATLGQTYLLRKKREDLLRQETLRLLDRFADEIYRQVLPWSVEGRKNDLLSRCATGKAGEMILNAAFLFLKPEMGLFKGKIDDLAEYYERDGLSFEISGPWPAYNFCPNFEAVDGGAVGDQKR